MTTAEYRARADQLRHLAEQGWALRESRAGLLKLAAIYETLAKATETLERLPTA